MKKIAVFLILLLLPPIWLQAQQDAQYTQYMYNTLSINPAYAGSRGVLSINALHRSQWLGLDGAPKTQTMSLHSPVSNRVGLGLSIVNDEIGNGTNQDTYFDAAFSYSVPTSENGILSLGLKAGGHLLNIDFNKLRNYVPNAMSGGNESVDKKFSPNFGIGVYYHTNRFYAGLSVPNFLKTDHFEGNNSTTNYLSQERLNLYLISGFILDINPDLQLKPGVLLKSVAGAPLQLDVSATFLLDQKFSLGAAYRWDAAISALVGFQFTDKFMVGMAYDKETTALGGTEFNDGSFEVFLRYELLTKFKKVLNPRFF
ncbi:type IX secretion system membrane protein, PorP/SprF family [Arenibacter nanhaiticus]|uniref:Type IX secretion system membrane protein, PorP/SprF family n=1 Tax=Arenibacter nanhaiticus TaxID=558155 RepID=A0A1M6N2F7_9FLAO|nr:type IX secretion system membrane protein PorP/SprF [Arenibacter nanhaiticus]SHJ89846.1 type IX secretion system membrane protein, PorP/SprF family [Arenibacter nanhaiticus]